MGNPVVTDIGLSESQRRPGDIGFRLGAIKGELMIGGLGRCPQEFAIEKTEGVQAPILSYNPYAVDRGPATAAIDNTVKEWQSNVYSSTLLHFLLLSQLECMVNLNIRSQSNTLPTTLSAWSTRLRTIRYSEHADGTIPLRTFVYLGTCQQLFHKHWI